MVPYSKVYNDNRYLLSPTYSTPNDFFENLRAAVGYLCDEAAAGHGARMMTVGLHERWSGQASRATAIRDFVEYAASRPDVRFMRRLDIARWWLAHHAEWDQAQVPSRAPAEPAAPAESAEPGHGGEGRQRRIRGTRADSPAGFGSRVGLLSSARPGLAAALCAEAAATGLDGIEWAAADAEGHRQQAARRAAELRRLADDHGLAVIGLSAQGDRAVTGQAGEFERLLDLAQVMRAPQLRVSAPPYAGGDVGDELRRLADQLAELAGLAGDRDVRLLVGISPGTPLPVPNGSGAPPEISGPSASAPYMTRAAWLSRAVLRPRSPSPPSAGICSTCTSRTWCRGTRTRRGTGSPPGPGQASSWPGVLAALAAADYGGWLVIGQLSGQASLRRDVAAVRQLVAGTPARPVSRPVLALGPFHQRKVTARESSDIQRCRRQRGRALRGAARSGPRRPRGARGRPLRGRQLG